MVRQHRNSFSAALKRGTSLAPQKVFQLLRKHIPGLKFVSRRKTVEDDKAGIDYVAHRRTGRPLFIDLKEVSYMPGADDRILLETEMQGRNRAEGWATDASKKTDLLLIVRGDGSVVVLSARQVREAISWNHANWSKKAGSTGAEETQGYYEVFLSRYILVRRSELEAACNEVARNWRN